MEFKYCPLCGKKLLLKKAGDDGLIPFCEKCDRYWFDIFSTCVIALIVNPDGEALLLKQSYISDKYSTFVAGYIQKGESAEEAVLREIKEEVGLNISELEIASSLWFDLKQILMIGFIAKTCEKDLILSPDVDSAEWVPIHEILQKIYPKHPNNIAYKIYEQYLNKTSNLTKHTIKV